MTHTRISNIARLTVAALLFTSLVASGVQAATTIIQVGQTQQIMTPTTIGENDIWVVRGKLENFSHLVNKGVIYLTGEFTNQRQATFTNQHSLYGASGPQAQPEGRLTNIGMFINEGYVERFEAHTFLNSGGTVELKEGYIYIHGLTNTSNGLIRIHRHTTMATYTLLNNIEGGIGNFGDLYVGEVQNQADGSMMNLGRIYEWAEGTPTIYNNGVLRSCAGHIQPSVVGNPVQGLSSILCSLPGLF